jgi:hypothetical protein
MRSLITLIALRTTGVSANRRRFIGVGLGNSCPGNWTGLNIAGNARVFRSASASAAAAAISAFRPLLVACRHISRNCSPTFTRTFLFSAAPKTKRHGPGKGHASFTPVVSEQLSVVSYPLITHTR